VPDEPRRVREKLFVSARARVGESTSYANSAALTSLAERAKMLRAFAEDTSFKKSTAAHGIRAFKAAARKLRAQPPI
jgi:hypothetical protein